jgi:hypothetical protein
MDQVARVVVALEAPDVAEEVMHFLDRSGRARVVATAGRTPSSRSPACSAVRRRPGWSSPSTSGSR